MQLGCALLAAMRERSDAHLKQHTCIYPDPQSAQSRCSSVSQQLS